ncbi:MAG: DUF4244 domain-containing protein [Actinobacteria bacterium]|nr:DUF4244 domain-containing protein [Actinomycetota bacterium]
MLKLITLIQSWVIVSVFRLRRLATDRGQTTAEYALVLVGVAAIALLILAWATKTGAIGKLFDMVLGYITGQVK